MKRKTKPTPTVSADLKVGTIVKILRPNLCAGNYGRIERITDEEYYKEKHYVVRILSIQQTSFQALVKVGEVSIP